MNAKKNAMAATVPVVRQLRKVPGFDPLKYLRTVSRNGEKVLKLDLSYKKSCGSGCQSAGISRRLCCPGYKGLSFCGRSGGNGTLCC